MILAGALLSVNVTLGALRGPTENCVAFTPGHRLSAGHSFSAAIGNGLEVRLSGESGGTWGISVSPTGRADDYLWLVSPPFQTAPHRQIGAGYNLTAEQSAKLSPRHLRFVSSAKEYQEVLKLVDRAQHDATGRITAADIRRKGRGRLELLITGFGTNRSGTALAWITVEGRACQPD